MKEGESEARERCEKMLETSEWKKEEKAQFTVVYMYAFEIRPKTQLWDSFEYRTEQQ